MKEGEGEKRAHSGGVSRSNMISLCILAIKYHPEISQKIPRSEVTTIAQLIRQQLSAIVGVGIVGAGVGVGMNVSAEEGEREQKQLVRMEVCGSYRRGKDVSSDVDILIGIPNVTVRQQSQQQQEQQEQMQQQMLQKLVERLKRIGLVVEGMWPPTVTHPVVDPFFVLFFPLQILRKEPHFTAEFVVFLIIPLKRATEVWPGELT